MNNTLLIAGSIAAIVAAIIGAVALVRTVMKERSLLNIKVFLDTKNPNADKDYLISLRITDRSNRIPNMDIGPQFDLLGGQAIQINQTSGVPLRYTFPRKNTVQYDVRVNAVRAEARRIGNIKYTGNVSARTVEGVWYTVKVPRVILKELTK